MSQEQTQDSENAKVGTVPKEESPGAQSAAGGNGHDPLDLSHLRLDPNYASTVGVKKIITSIAVRKPNRQEFIRVHPDENYRLVTAVLEDKLNRGTNYLVVGDALRETLAAEIVAKILFTTITRQGVLLLWPVRLPGPDGRLDAWNACAHDVAELAMKKWIKLVSNQAAGSYDVFQAEGDHGEPEWPELSFQEIVRIAFKEFLIDDYDHPFLQRLRGKI